ncbi:hypothetical protein P171DRAFT_465451 [Karstenula rhodostoma CBS 690.94]|uniref:NACHT domain-containing protein n=1 Tax=Karstenula rhodostoma CBS 690.94 TaxID=1392251 RepID=A0A9P4U9B8_9PLEO|nr:hypothetical protein P171DRAFT_465451 [Karstenula rhodostoma CBS 690.94]
MGLDPFSALGIAANVVQFIEFGSKLVSESHEIYKSATGTSTGIVELEMIYTDLIKFTKSLQTPNNSSQTPEEESLRQLAASCLTVANELLNIINALKVNADGHHRKWRSFRQAMKSTWKQTDIDNLQKRLADFRGQLTVRLLGILGDRQSSVLHELQVLAGENRRMNANQTEKIDGLADALESLRRTIQDSASSAPSQLDLHSLSVKLVELNSRASCLAKEQHILGSLRFKTMSARLSRIQEAHGTTFSWIFDPDCDAGFTDWLHHDRGIYWISGKPGSGKSTLMKYLYEEQRTREALHVWADGSKLVMAAFFFWSVGTPMQKSQEGLLRCLLFEIFRRCPDLIATACPERWIAEDTSTDGEGWDLAELSDVIFRIFSSEHASTTKFCFFIDGLDEYEGRHLDIVRILDTLASSTQSVKVCVSSRQWNVFEDAYGRDASRLLYLEDLTRGDIEDYVRSKFEEHTAITMFSIAEDGYDGLIEDIVNKAEGVFLWVFLVVRSLCEGLTNGDDVYLLQERVRRLPADLEHYFRLIIESVEVEYREIMARTFQVALQATEPLTLIAYSFLDEADPDYAINARIRAFDRNDIFVRHRQTKRRINGRYKGLLEVSAESSASDFFGYRVEFFHRTVHDFLQLKEIQKLLSSYLSNALEETESNTSQYIPGTLAHIHVSR